MGETMEGSQAERLILAACFSDEAGLEAAPIVLAIDLNGVCS